MPVTEYGYDDLPHLMARMIGDEKHDLSATSTLDVIWVLYDRVLRVGPDTVDDPDRDRFLLSKGHGPMAYYAVLAAKGFIDGSVLDTFGRYDSLLGHHPDRTLVPGVEIGAGSLGHGLGLAVGTALGQRIAGRAARTVVLIGDGELDEGSNFEAIQYAGRAGLDRLLTVVIDNRTSSQGWPGGIAARFAVEGWSTADVDGRDHDALHRAFATPTAGRPHAVVAHVPSHLDPEESR